MSVDDQATNLQQHLMEAVPVGDDEKRPTGAGGGMNDSRHGSSEGDEGHIVPKRDEAIGARPPTRRGRPDPPRRAQNQPRGYDDDETGIDDGEAGREIFSDCTTPDAPDGIDADHDDHWNQANGLNGIADGNTEILRLSGSENDLLIDAESQDESEEGGRKIFFLDLPYIMPHVLTCKYECVFPTSSAN